MGKNHSIINFTYLQCYASINYPKSLVEMYYGDHTLNIYM